MCFWNKVVVLAILASAAVDAEAATHHVRRAAQEGEQNTEERKLWFYSSSGKGKGSSKGSSTGEGGSSGGKGRSKSSSGSSDGKGSSGKGKGGSKGSKGGGLGGGGYTGYTGYTGYSSSGRSSSTKSSKSSGGRGGGSTGNSGSATKPADYIMAVLKEDNKYCIAAKDVKSGKELEIVKCDPHDYKQLWVLDSMKRWRPKKDLDLCVEVSGNIFSKMQNPRLKKCDGYKDQKWTYNKKDDDEISPDMERSVCVTYDTHSPSSGDTIELDHCNGKSEQGWKIVDPGDY